MEPDLASPSTGASATSGAGAPLNGTLEDNTPAGVLQVLSSQRETGAVRFSGESGCTVYLHEGELYFAETAETGEDLAIAVVRPGRLTADEWDRSTAAGYPNETVGEELISTGSVTRDLLASIVLSVIYDPLIQLFRAPEGDFEFEPNVVHWIGPYRTFGVDAIVAEVRRRTREADEMAPVVPSLDAIVHSARTLPEDRGSVNLRRDDWEVVVAAAAGRTVSEIAVELGRGRWSTARLVYRLASVDLLEVEPALEAASTSFDEPRIDESEAAESRWDAPASESTDPAESPWGPPANETVESSDSAWGAPTTETAEPWDTPAADTDPNSFGEADRRLSDGPPPLDASAFTAVDDDTDENGHGTTGTDWSSGSWDATDPAADEAPTGVGTGFVDAPADEATEADDDAWGTSSIDQPAPADPSWDSPPSTTDDWASGDTIAAPESTFDATSSAWGSAEPTSFTDEQGAEYTFEPPALHPDIAKALAESTYADSATAINAMAARLGASDTDDDDDDDDWDSGASTGGETDEFWSNDAAAGADAGTAFTWQPAAWDTGVEAVPLPQREHVPRDPDDESGPGGSADPEWLENLYTQFMPGDAQAGTKGPNSVEQALGAQPAPPPKNRSLRRLMKAIKRL